MDQTESRSGNDDHKAGESPPLSPIKRFPKPPAFLQHPIGKVPSLGDHHRSCGAWNDMGLVLHPSAHAQPSHVSVTCLRARASTWWYSRTPYVAEKRSPQLQEAITFAKLDEIWILNSQIASRRPELSGKCCLPFKIPKSVAYRALQRSKGGFFV